MTRPTRFDRRLLGDLAPAAFLSRHWQRSPLLVRGAVADPAELAALPDRDRLVALAARDDVESRLVERRRGRWSLAHGPLARLPRASRDWTLLVQGVNLVDAAADALMRRFDFVSAMRLDDLMMSCAVDGGGVGPHVDSYDVFLLQVAGRRRWRWSDAAATAADDDPFVAEAPLKILRRFEPTDEAVLEPGDLLYLPPSCPHEGTADGPCITASIGFRAPTWDELAREYLYDRADRVAIAGRVVDRGRAATTTPARVDAALLDTIVARLSALRSDAADIARFVGVHFSEPKNHVVFDRPAPISPSRFARRAAVAGLVFDRRAIALYRRRDFFVAGEAFRAPASTARPMAAFADRRALPAAVVARLLDEPATAALLREWWQHGWIHFADGTRDDRS